MKAKIEQLISDLENTRRMLERNLSDLYALLDSVNGPAPDVIEPESVAEPEPEPVADDAIRFTLNDRYRFRRELFGNSDAAMADVMALLSAMNSEEEVTDYLTGDLGWDVSNQDVSDFLAVAVARFR